MNQVSGMLPVSTGGGFQPVGDEVTEGAGIATTGNAAIETAFGLKPQNLCREGLFCLAPIARTDDRWTRLWCYPGSGSHGLAL